MNDTSTINETTPDTAADGDRALCLCCIGRAGELTVPGGAGYEPDQSLRAIDEGPLRAVVIDLDAAYLTGAGASERLESVEWLVPRAERHEAIIAEAAAASPIIPARFGCVFSGEEPLREMLAGHESLLWNSLDTVDGASEFAVRILVDRERAVDAMLNGGGSGATGGGSAAEAGGASWMQQRRQRRDAGRELGPWLAERLRGPIDAVQGVARAACRHRIVEKQRDGREVVANWAFLVSHEDRAAFEDAVARAAGALGDIGAEVACGGPWAPYSFAPSVAAA
jgi:hypothetical protein